MKNVIFFKSNLPVNFKTKIIFLLFSIVAVIVLFLSFFIALALGVLLIPVGLLFLPKILRFKKQKIQRNSKIIETREFKRIEE